MKLHAFFLLNLSCLVLAASSTSDSMSMSMSMSMTGSAAMTTSTDNSPPYSITALPRPAASSIAWFPSVLRILLAATTSPRTALVSLLLLMLSTFLQVALRRYARVARVNSLPVRRACMIAIVTVFTGLRHSARRLWRNRVLQLRAVSDFPFFGIRQTGEMQE
jgi:hypothetical protein